MTDADSDFILRLVRKALDEFDDRPLDVSVRRAMRIASLIGDTQYAIRLGLELRPMGGDRETNRETSRMLMSDPTAWGSMSGPAEQALRQYMNDRRIRRDDGEEAVEAHSLAEMEFWDKELADLKESGEVFDYKADLAARERQTQILSRTRHLTFCLLCSWERRLGYSAINESIFGSYRVKVDALLADGVPELLVQFNAVYRRLQEAADSAPDRDVVEELSQAITTCRRILKAVVDHVFPAREGMSEDRRPLDDPSYRTRFSAYLKQAMTSDSDRALMDVMVAGLFDRFRAVDKLTSKAVHATVALETANLCALSTYVVCGEIVSLHAALAAGQEAEPTSASEAAAP